MAKRKWSYKTYGKTALRNGASFQAGGLEEYLQRIQQAGRDIDAATAKAVEESSKAVLADMVEGAERHRRTGAVVNALEAEPVVQEGNVFSAKVGINIAKHPEAIHAVFQEYGAPHFPADPFIRPALDNKSKIKRIQRDVLIREGMPIE